MKASHAFPTRRQSPTRQRNGATIVLVAIFVPILLMIVGFSVDYAYMQLARAELQSATDLAAKAASTELADSGNIASAIAKGKAIAAENLVAGSPLTLENGDFVFGHTVRSATGKWTFTANGSPTNAVQINSRRTSSSPDGEIDLFFSGLGGYAFETGASATSGFVNVDICLVLDRSSSMKLPVSDPNPLMDTTDPRYCDSPWGDSRWVALENAVQIFVTKMNATLAEEKVSIVTFASGHTACSVTVQSATLDQQLTTYMPDINNTMSSLTSSIWFGMTEISEGMQLGINELNGPNSRPTAQKIMVVLTDGAYTNAVDPVTIATDAANDDIRVHTVTFGALDIAVRNHMASTAAAGGGNHYHAPDAATLNSVFTQIAGSIAILTE